MLAIIINEAIVPELNGSPISLTKNNSIKLKNLRVGGSINLNTPIRIATPIILANRKFLIFIVL